MIIRGMHAQWFCSLSLILPHRHPLSFFSDSYLLSYFSLSNWYYSVLGYDVWIPLFRIFLSDCSCTPLLVPVLSNLHLGCQAPRTKYFWALCQLIHLGIQAIRYTSYLGALGTKKNNPCQANRCNFKLLSSWCPAPCLIVS